MLGSAPASKRAFTALNKQEAKETCVWISLTSEWQGHVIIAVPDISVHDSHMQSRPTELMWLIHIKATSK